MDVFLYNTHNQGHCSDTCLSLFQCCFVMFFFGTLPKFEANIERNREKEVEHKKHNMSTSFLQLKCHGLQLRYEGDKSKQLTTGLYNCYSCRNSLGSPTYCPGPAHSDNLARQIPLYCPCFGYPWVYRAITPPRGSSVSPWQLQPFTGSLINGSSKLGLVRIFVPLTGGLYAENSKTN